jgi:hypothetical protein
MSADRAGGQPDSRSGLDAEGNWTPAFKGQRPPFTPGNEYGRPPEHGAYAVLHLTPRAAAISGWIRSLAEHLTPADEPAVQTLGLTLAQLERAAGVLGEVDEAIKRGDDVDVYLGRIESRARLSQDARRWADSARRMMDDLGLTPAGRAALEAAQQPPGIPAPEVQGLFSAFFRVAIEYVDSVRRQEFMRRIDAVSAPLLGELPAGETTDAEEGAKP